MAADRQSIQLFFIITITESSFQYIRYGCAWPGTFPVFLVPQFLTNWGSLAFDTIKMNTH